MVHLPHRNNKQDAEGIQNMSGVHFIGEIQITPNSNFHCLYGVIGQLQDVFY